MAGINLDTLTAALTIKLESLGTSPGVLTVDAQGDLVVLIVESIYDKSGRDGNKFPRCTLMSCNESVAGDMFLRAVYASMTQFWVTNFIYFDGSSVKYVMLILISDFSPNSKVSEERSYI